MAHDIMKDSVEAQTGRASIFIVGILLGGVLVLSSNLVTYLGIFARASYQIDRRSYNFFADSLALIGALLLSIPIIGHALKHMLEGETNMDELVALAVIAAMTAMDYRTAGAVAFFLLLANLV